MADQDQLALYRRWRPQTFSEVVAQEQVVYPLRQSVIDGSFAHALLFSGTRGTGKTSLAKIFAKAINCEHPNDGNPCNQCNICRAANDGSLMDIYEIDAASHNSVDHVRRLTEEIIFTPVKARYKVYIIDEVHMLSTGAFNALLKTLEEPPAHAVFVLATTEPHRIPATIISRCQHFKFRRIPNDEIIERIRTIAEAIDLDIEPDALDVIAQLAGGALRDAISLLDQTRQLPNRPVSRDDVLALAGRVPDQFLSETAEAILFQDPETLLKNIQDTVMSGRDLTRFVTDLGAYFRHLLVCSVSDTPSNLIQLRTEDIDHLQALADRTNTETLIRLISGLAELSVSLRFSPDLRTTLEIGLIELAHRAGHPAPAAPANAHPAPAPPKKAAPPPTKAEPPIPEPEPIEAPEPEPIEAPEPEPIEDPEPIPEPEPVEASEPEPMEEPESKPMEAPEPEPTDAKEPAPQPESKAPTDAPTTTVNNGTAIETNQGTENVLDVWSDVLDKLLEDSRIDIALCARPAYVCVHEGVFEIHLDEKLKGQYLCLADRANKGLLADLLQERVGHGMPLEIMKDTSGDNQGGASAEWPWLEKARNTAMLEDLPNPDNPDA
ncbi:MAG: DNA polymerase III subunit gamma/tau [Saccharofermentanales bacterium]|jgi:DNA polymerase III subunit gamma/tau